MNKWLFIALVVVGLLALAAVIWFAGPLLGFGDTVPLEAEWVRLVIIAVIWAIAGGIYVWRFLRARAATRSIEKGLVESAGNDSDAKVLAERMSDALQTLKGASGKADYLYNLPWYLIIGPPGAGKTTALLRSGLKFPLADASGGAPVQGVAGTRYCDWWFTDEAVLIDTAGRYTTQDSDAETDKRSWLSFLSLLKRNRPKQPINGVIVAISLADLMTLPPDQLAAHSAAIRRRLVEVHQELKVDLPVYVLFTKADLIAGFNEYFGNFTESRRRKVWGATFQSEDRHKNMIGSVPGEFNALVRRLTEELADRLQEEADAGSRIKIFGFPAQFAMLGDRVNDFLRQIFEANRYQVNANLRGFYFSSGTQEGTPIDQVLGAMAGGQDGPTQMSGLGKSFFLHDLIQKVIFSESGWVSQDAAAVRRSAFLRYGTAGLVGIGTVALLGLWGWSYANNQALIADTKSFMSSYTTAAEDELSRTSIGDYDLMEVVPALNLLGGNPVGYEHRNDGVPLPETFGLSQRSELVAASSASYRAALERMLRSRLILRLESQLQESANDPRAAYEALKVYLMMGGVAEETDDDYIVAWMKADWDSLYAGPQLSGERTNLERHLRAMLALDDGRQPTFQLNQTLIDSARATLTRLGVADQAYGYLEILARAEGLPDFNVAQRAGAESALVFETVDGSDFGTLSIPALYTYRGFHELFLPQLSSIAEKLVKEKWVRGDLAPELASASELRKLGPELLRIYSQEFVANWRGMLDNIRFRTLPGEAPDYTTLAVASNPNASPVTGLVQAIVAETALTREPVATAGTEEAASNPASDLVNQVQARTSGLARIGIDFALRKSQARPGDAPATQQIPGAGIEDQFKDYATLLEGEPPYISSLIANLGKAYESLRRPGTEGTAALDDAVTGLSISASHYPRALQRMIDAAVGDLQSDVAGSNKAQLNQLLASDVTRACQEVVTGYYPFDATSRRDLPMDDFSRVFQPSGIIDRFFAEHLTTLVDRSVKPWVWKDSKLGSELSRSALRSFERAAEIRDAFFPPGAAQPQVTVTLTQESMNPSIEMALLEVNGQVYQSQQSGNAPKTIQWPGTMGGGGAVTISLQPEMLGRQASESVVGPWAFMRVILHNTFSRRGDTMYMTITVDGREVVYGVQVGRISNPFFLPALEEFTCPTSL